MSKKGSLAKNTLIIAFGSLSVQFVSFLLLPLYTAYLSTSDFGIVDLIITYTSLLTPVVTLQMQMAAFRFLVDAREDDKAKTAIVSTSLHVVGAVVLSLLALFLLVSQFVHIAYATLVALTVFFASFSGLFMQAARGLGNNKVFAIGAMVAGFTTILLNILLIVAFDMGAAGMLWAGVIGSAACAIYTFLALKLYRYTRLKAVDHTLRRELLRYSLPLIPNVVSWWIINAFDRTIITIFLGLSSNGIYAIAYKFPFVFNSLFSFFNMSWTESASLHINSPDRNKFFSEVSSICVRFFGSLAALIIAFLPLVFDMFIDEKYREAYLYIPILIAGSFFSALVGQYSAIYIAKKMTKQVASTSVLAAIINIVIGLSLIHWLGLYATALATAIAYAAMAFYRHHDVKKYVTITYEKYVFVKIGALYGLAACLYYLDHQLLNILNAVLVTGLSLWIVRDHLSVLKQKVMSKIKPLTPDQKVARTLETEREINE